MPIQRISKIDAVRRQIDTAITMFFSGMDDISIFTLVNATLTVLRNLCKHVRRDSILDTIMAPEHKKDYIMHISKAANFFKHADRDPVAILEWNAKEELNDSLILQACLDFQSITDPITWPMNYFVIWFALAHPNLIKPEVSTQFETEEAEVFRAASRQQRLKLGRQAVSQEPTTWKPLIIEATRSARA